MKKEDQEIIRRNRTGLVKTIVNIGTVCDYLQENGIFTPSMIEEVQGQKTKSDKVRQILDYIVRRGPETFNMFYDILVMSGDGEAADILKPSLASSRRLAERQRILAAKNGRAIQHQHLLSSAREGGDVDDELPKVWPDMKDPPVSIAMKNCDPNDPEMMEKFAYSGRKGIYPMTNSCHGRAVIINNFDFTPAQRKDLANRTGTDKDRDVLLKMFQELKYEVRLHEDKTAEGIRKLLTEESSFNHSQSDCFVLCILTHGTLGQVYGTDGQLVAIKEIMDAFDGQNCPSLVKKPKLFFIQACQGESKDAGSVPGYSQTTTSLESLEKQMKDLNLTNFTKIDATEEQSVPTKADMCVVLATTADYVSWRNITFGTWFIQALAYIIKKFAYKDSLNTLLVKVNKLVSRAETAVNSKQVSNFYSTLTEEFYFFPGLPLSPSAPLYPFAPTANGIVNSSAGTQSPYPQALVTGMSNYPGVPSTGLINSNLVGGQTMYSQTMGASTTPSTQNPIQTSHEPGEAHMVLSSSSQSLNQVDENIDNPTETMVKARTGFGMGYTELQSGMGSQALSRPVQVSSDDDLSRSAFAL